MHRGGPVDRSLWPGERPGSRPGGPGREDAEKAARAAGFCDVSTTYRSRAAAWRTWSGRCAGKQRPGSLWGPGRWAVSLGSCGQRGSWQLPSFCWREAWMDEARLSQCRVLSKRPRGWREKEGRQAGHLQQGTHKRDRTLPSPGARQLLNWVNSTPERDSY